MRTIVLVLAAMACGGGGLTAAQLEAAKETVHAMQPIEEAKASLTATLGEPTRSDEAGLHWFANEGGTCKELLVGVMGTSVGAVEVRDGACP
jgi:hypothetical protein